MSGFQQPEFSYDGISSDMDNLREALDGVLRKSGHPLPAGEHRRLLNLACGRADETGVLTGVFGKDVGQLDIFGADLRAAEIEEARARWKPDPETGLHTSFQCGDGLRILDGLDADSRFEVAFLRHQNYWNGNSLWQGMFDRSLHRLTADGFLVITSYFDLEHRQACEALERLGAEKIADFRNPKSRLISAKHQKSVDRHIAVFRKPNPV